MADSWNPEPPAEILSIQKDDLIEGTLFDKHTIVQILLKLIRLVDDPVTSEQEATTPSHKELDEELEKELCDLWDMSSERGVCEFLNEYNCLSLFEAYMNKYDSVYPRAVELLLGIIVNMVTLVDEISLKLVETSSFINYLLVRVFIGMTDTQSILQSVYLLNILVGYAEEEKGGARFLAKEKLIKLIYDETDQDAEYLSPMLEKILFILGQSLNGSLLDCTCSLLLNLMYTSDSYLIKIAQDERVVESICSAGSTRSSLSDQAIFTKEGYSTTRSTRQKDTSTRTPNRPTEPTESDQDISDLDRVFNKYFLCLQTLSTCESGTARLNESSECVIKLISEYINVALGLLSSWEAQHGVKILDGLIGAESISNFACLTSTLDAVISSSTSVQSKFLVKFLSFSSYYLRFLVECKEGDVEVENSDLTVSAVRELLNTLKDFSDTNLDEKLNKLVSEYADLVSKL